VSAQRGKPPAALIQLLHTVSDRGDVLLTKYCLVQGGKGWNLKPLKEGTGSALAETYGKPDFPSIPIPPQYAWDDRVTSPSRTNIVTGDKAEQNRQLQNCCKSEKKDPQHLTVVIAPQ